MFQQSNSSQPSDLAADLRNWWDTCPLFTRFVIYVCSGLLALTMLSNMAPMLVNQPSKTIGEFQITRLIFSPFCFLTIAELLIAFFAYLPMLAGQEKDSGTLAAIVDFFVKNLEINIVFIVVCYVLGHVFPIFKQFQAYGLWNIFFMHLVEQCLRKPEETTSLFCLPFQVKNQIYPLVLLIIFSIISNIIRLDIFVAIALAYLHQKYLNVFYHEFLNQTRIESWENSQWVSYIKSMPRYVKYGSMSGPLINEHDNQMENNANYPPIGGEYNPNYPPIGDYDRPRDDKNVHLDIYNTPEINFEDADSRKNSLKGGKKDRYDLTERD